MLLAETKDSDEDIAEEIEAFQPLIPSGKELIFTLMFEIDSKVARERILTEIAGVEDHVYLKLGDGEGIRSVPIDGEEGLSRLDNHGKTSAVHFRKFIIEDAEALKFPASIAIEHPHYGHSATMTEAMVQELKRDLD